MTRNLYALLVGINDYAGGVSGLKGCVNDVTKMKEFLERRTQGGEFDFKPLVLTSDYDHPDEVKPTRQNVINAFRDHLCQAGPDDVALFYYSGHGSQEKAPPELWHLEPDHLDETIVCYDSRTDGSWDLADKELGLLISEVAQEKPHVIVILDACHSGSGTRAPEEPGVRLASNDKRDRPLDTFEGFQQLKQQKPVAEGEAASEWLVLPEGKHVVVSACRPEEVANERFLGDDIHGLLSYYLLDTLQRAGSGLTYRDIFARVSTLVRNQAALQDPVIEATELRQLQEPFLGGAVKPEPAYFALTYHADQGWAIGGGAINGIAEPVRGETTTLAVFAITTDLGSVKTIDEAIGTAKVTAVEPGLSTVAFTLKSGEQPNRKDAFKALVVSQPLPPVLVLMQGDQAGLDLVREALKTAGSDREPSLIVQELSQADRDAAAKRAGRDVADTVLAPLTLIARDERYLIRRTDDAFPLMVPVEQGYDVGAAATAVQRLEQVARWLQIALLDNKTSVLPVDAVTMELYAVNDDGSLGERLDVTGGEIRLEYKQQAGAWKQPRFKLKLVNNSDRRLYCALLDLTETFGVTTAGLLRGGGEWLEPQGSPAGSELWAFQGKSIPAAVPKALRDKGVVRLRDIIKLIASTTEVPATLLEMDELDVATRSVKEAPDAPKSTLARLYQRVQTRAVGDEAEEDEAVVDWVTSQVTLTTVHPGEGVDVPDSGEAVTLADVVHIQPHPDLKAKVRVTTFAEGSRDAGNLALPAVFRQNPQLASPFQFARFRSGEPGPSVLELQVAGTSYQTVTAENPLVVQVDQTIAVNEYVLPLAFDREAQLFLPLGRCERRPDGVTISIERLPAPESDAKDVGGSLKLFFQKVVGEKIGLGGETARLAVATVNQAGEVEYEDSPAAVKEKIKAADRILLYIHGFTGDTRGMVRSARGLPYPVDAPPPILADQYDLILAFDYENIYTSIEETALALKKRLADAGLGPGHGKTLHVIAHALGALVTRWFVEREGGARVVQKAVLVGPPNAGTPWAKIEDWIIVGLGAAINGIAGLIWPPAAIPALVGALVTIVKGAEQVDTTLDELKPDSLFYKLLNTSDDPCIPYVIVAGNTSKIERPAEAAKAEQALLGRLVERLASIDTRRTVGDLVFFGKPNDTSIGVDSMSYLPGAWSAQPDVREIPCDHVSYFSTLVGLQTLATALA